MNPFKGRTMPIDERSMLFFREKYFEDLEERIKSRKQTAILGVEGVGKSSLIGSFFDREYRIQKALEGILISPLTEFSARLKNEEIYNHFSDMAINSARILCQCGKTEEMNAILAQAEEIRQRSSGASARFQETVSLIHNTFGYRIVMLVDNFEVFTSSAEVTIAHHEMMRSLLNYSQYIVVTNYDLNQDSLPPDVSASLFLMNFADNNIEVSGWSGEETRAFLSARLKDNKIQFSDNLMQNTLYAVSGGIPELLNIAADHAYRYIEEHGTEDGLMFNPAVYENERVQTLMSHWCTMLSIGQIAAIKDMMQNGGEGSTSEASVALRTLSHRGIVAKAMICDAFGHTTESDNQYRCCCKLFGTFCNDAGRLEDAASKNPLIKLRENAPEDASADITALREAVTRLARELGATGAKIKKTNEDIKNYAEGSEGYRRGSRLLEDLSAQRSSQVEGIAHYIKMINLQNPHEAARICTEYKLDYTALTKE